jgi:hypothetical protein
MTFFFRESFGDRKGTTFGVGSEADRGAEPLPA